MGVLGAVVVGAGQAGLAASFHLRRLGIDHVVLERGQVGETWRSQRWASFALNTPGWLNRLAGEPEVTDGRDAFATGAAFAARLGTYADRHGLPIRTGATVVDVTADGTADDVLSVAVADPDGRRDEPIRASSVVVASGILNVPKIPPVAAALPSDIVQLSAADYRDPAALPDGAVMVVGSAQSGVQIAEDLLESGRAVYLCTSAVARLRRRYRGRDSFESLARAGFWEQTVATLPDPAMQWWPNPATSGVGPLGHTVSLQWLAARGVTLLGRPAAVLGDRLQLDESVGANIAFGDKGAVTIRAMLDRGIAAAGWEPAPIEPDPADEPHPDPMSVPSPTELDLRSAKVRTVIWTTGFTGDFAFLPPAAFDNADRPLHDAGVSPLPGLYHVGYPWLTKRRSGIIAGVDEDGAMIAQHVAARLAGHGARRPAPAQGGTAT